MVFVILGMPMWTDLTLSFCGCSTVLHRLTDRTVAETRYFTSTIHDDSSAAFRTETCPSNGNTPQNLINQHPGAGCIKGENFGNTNLTPSRYQYSDTTVPKNIGSRPNRDLCSLDVPQGIVKKPFTAIPIWLRQLRHPWVRHWRHPLIGNHPLSKTGTFSGCCGFLRISSSGSTPSP